jgi:hypothetical protein
VLRCIGIGGHGIGCEQTCPPASDFVVVGVARTARQQRALRSNWQHTGAALSKAGMVHHSSAHIVIWVSAACLLGRQHHSRAARAISPWHLTAAWCVQGSGVRPARRSRPGEWRRPTAVPSAVSSRMLGMHVLLSTQFVHLSSETEVLVCLPMEVIFTHCRHHWKATLAGRIGPGSTVEMCANQSQLPGWS